MIGIIKAEPHKYSRTPEEIVRSWENLATGGINMQIPVCKECGGNDISLEARVIWNPEKNEWEMGWLDNMYDNAGWCENPECVGHSQEIEFTWKEI
tara:strand:+ start:87 stop:374 length:288 start_codon:yes stop_codon:yes gene_type:complete